MSRNERSFRDRATSGEALVGTFLNTGSPLSAEISSFAGFDWVVLDWNTAQGLRPTCCLSFTPSPRPLLRASCGLRRLPGSASEERSTWAHPGLMVPRVETIEQAREAVSLLRYPPGWDSGALH